MKYIHLHSYNIYEYLSENNFLNKNIHFLCILPEGVKYIFCRQTLDSSNTDVEQGNADEITVLKGYQCEVSDLLECPECMSEDDYSLIPEDYKGTVYNIYYIPSIHKVKIRYVEQGSTTHNNVLEPNNTANFITWIDNNKLVNIFTEIYNAEQIIDMELNQFTDIFIEYER